MDCPLFTFANFTILIRNVFNCSASSNELTILFSLFFFYSKFVHITYFLYIPIIPISFNTNRLIRSLQYECTFLFNLSRFINGHITPSERERKKTEYFFYIRFEQNVLFAADFNT